MQIEALPKKLEKQIWRLIADFDHKSVRRKLVQLHRNNQMETLFEGRWEGENGQEEEFVLSSSGSGLSLGTRERSGFCRLSKYSETGELLWEMGKENMDIKREVLF